MPRQKDYSAKGIDVIFKNRIEAGVKLSEKLTSFRLTDAFVLGLARGGVVVASVISRTLSFPLDVLVVKKLASRMDPELAIGAVAPDGVLYIDWGFAHRLGIDEDTVNSELAPEVQQLIEERSLLYHRGRKRSDIKGKTVLLVDDGAATGATMRVAVRWAKKKKARKVIVAVPVAPPEVIKDLQPEADVLVVLDTPTQFRSVGQFYEQFSQVSDEEVVTLLRSYTAAKA